MNEPIYPVEISREQDHGILIRWSDDQSTRWTAAELRRACPCATCRERKGADRDQSISRGLPVLSAAEARPLRIESMRPVGNYAYSIAFSDGHSSGVYLFEQLRKPSG